MTARNANINRMRWLYAICMSVFMLNDVVYWQLDGTFGLYLADWAFRIAMILFVIAAWQNFPPGPKERGSEGVKILFFFGLLAFWLFCEPISARLGSGWTLFLWRPIENYYLWILDLTVGLALVAVVEEAVGRRLALAVLPGPMWARLIVSSLLFSLMHWGQGYGLMVENSLIGFAFGIAYIWTGSIRLVIVAHYAVDFLVFGLGAGEL